jgi:hypothetical protein|tara:strand:- start:5408 stop:5644 length:237 start_codon:yes stop_codon:yes gene_type:complete
MGGFVESLLTIFFPTFQGLPQIYKDKRRIKMSKNKTWQRVQKIRNELDKLPNGWPLSRMVGNEYQLNAYEYRDRRKRV